MAKVCFGCGLDQDTDGNLVVDVNDSTWPTSSFGTESSCGAPVYCTTSGGLHVGPRAKSGIFNKEATFNLGSNGIATIGDEQEQPGTITGTVQNPSSCLAASALINITADFDIRIPEDARFRMYAAGDQCFDFTNRGDATIIDMGWNIQIPYLAVTIPAGGSHSISIPITMSSTGADSVLSKFQYFINAIVIAANA